MKKKSFWKIGFAVVGMVMLLCACGGDDNGNDPGNNGGNETTHTHDWNTTPETISEGVQGKKCKQSGCNEITDLIFTYAVGADGTGGGKIIYVADGLEYRSLGFTVTGLGTCYYLEAAPTNQTTGICWSSEYVYVTGATGTAIGTGKANTVAIIAAHPGDTVSNNAAKAAVSYTGGGKNDWFLPSKAELNEMYKAKSHLSISSGIFWFSSQSGGGNAWDQDFLDGFQYTGNKTEDYELQYAHAVRAVRAF